MRLICLIFTLALPAVANQALAQRPEWPTPAEYTARVQQEAEQATQQAAATEPEPASMPATANDADTSSYVVQLGAFRQRASAESAALETGIENLRIMTSDVEGVKWYVLVLGTYADRGSAVAASNAYLRTNPDSAAWVRQSAGLR